jgi:diguanylate cyclase (GGDEF)-like protein/PAS domain S-box-containing protein
MGNSPPQSVWIDFTARGKLFTDVFEFSADPLVVVDVCGRMIEANAAMEKVTGIPRADLVGSDFKACFHQPEQVQEVLQRVALERKIRGCEWRVMNQDGGSTEVVCNATLFRDAMGLTRGTFFVLRDATDLRQYESQMLFQANYDALTALPNRRKFRDQIIQALLRTRDNGRSMAILFIDLDNFKDINDTLGHVIGDEVLKVVAAQLVASLGEFATVARMGGDGFAALIEDAGSETFVQSQMEGLLSAVARSCAIEGHEVMVSCSIGGTLYPGNNGDVDTLLRNAEAAMYRAKEAGKNRCQLFTVGMDAEMQRRVNISHRLRSALKKSEFVLHYQPKVALGTGNMRGVEALIRWQTHGNGMISPAHFIPVAERNGMILPIGEWVLFEACRQAREWQKVMTTPITMAVNLSARQLRDVDIVDLVVRVLEETSLPARLLDLELTESMLVHDTQRVLRTLEALKEVGVSLSIDDFGTGYSSLSYLKNFPLDYLKIDRAFVMGLPGDKSDGAIVRAVIDMAHSLGMQVIAEGIETRGQLDFLLAHDCDEMQGYYFSKPLPNDQLVKLVNDGRRLDK